MIRRKIESRVRGEQNFEGFKLDDRRCLSNASENILAQIRAAFENMDKADS